MYDIVLEEGLGIAPGIKGNLVAGKIRKFIELKGPAQAKLAKVKGALLYSPQYGLETGAYKELANAKGSLIFSFKDLLHEAGFKRAILISKMRMALAECRKAGCGYLFCTLASKNEELRSAREIRSFMAVLGLNSHEMAFAQKNSHMVASNEALV